MISVTRPMRGALLAAEHCRRC